MGTKRTGKKRILLVEDERAYADMIKLRLEAHGFKVLIARDGAEGFRLATEELPDLILLDIMMPKMDGLSVLEKIKRNEKTVEIPVVMLTASAEKDMYLRSKELWASEFLLKTCEPEQLLSVIEAHLAK
jgi:DNA-binding response OmpR family regulator